jgi:hypothetical protein
MGLLTFEGCGELMLCCWIYNLWGRVNHDQPMSLPEIHIFSFVAAEIRTCVIEVFQIQASRDVI